MTKAQRLLQLKNVENATQLLLAAAEKRSEINPYDYCYRALDCNLQVVNEESTNYEILMRYINNSIVDSTDFNNTVVKSIFEVSSNSGQNLGGL